MAPRYILPLLTCTFSILTLLTSALADDPTPINVSTINSTEEVYTVTDEQHYVGTGTPGLAKRLEFSDANATFDLGAVIFVTDSSNPVKITNSTLQLSWSGKKLDADESDEDFTDKKNAYLISDYGGFGGTNPLDVLVKDSTITFNIQEENEPNAWYIDSYKIHIDGGTAKANIEEGIVAARAIDDIVVDTSTNGNLEKTGTGTLVIGGSTHEEAEPESGLNISGTLTITKGTVNLAGDRELAVGDRETAGSATTEHYAKNVEIEDGSTLDISTGAILKLTNTDPDTADIAINEGGTLRIANSAKTDIYNTDKNTVIGVDGGTVKIYAGTSDVELAAPSVDAKLGENGGTIDVADTVTFENRSVTGTGDYTKTGKGTHTVNEFDLDGNIVVTEGTSTLASGNHQAGRMIIGGSETEAEAVVELNSGAWVQLTNNPAEGVTDIADKADIVIQKKGTLRVSGADGTGIFKYDETEDFPYIDTTLLVDGGTVEIIKGDAGSADPETLRAETIHTVVGTGGGTINIAENVIFESGSISAANLSLEAAEQGNIVKKGNGTYIAGNINLGSGAFEVQEGTVGFAGNAAAGTLKSVAGTTINALAEIDTENPKIYEFVNFEIAGTYDGGGHNLTVGSGEVTGTLTDIDLFTAKGSLNLNSDKELKVNRLNITAGAGTALDLKAGTQLQLMNNDVDKNDIEIRGTLKVASADGTGIFKKEGENFADIKLFSDGGTVEIYMPEENGKNYLLADTIHTELGTNGGIISVTTGLTFESGSITGEINSEKVTGLYEKQGKGTHVVNGMSIGGTIQIKDGKTVLKSGADETGEHAVSAVIAGGATLEISQDVSLTLTDMMAIKTGGVVINNGTLTMDKLDIVGGTLQLQLTPTQLLGEGETAPPATINTGTFSVSDGGKITVGNDQFSQEIRTYKNIINVSGGISNQSLAELNKNQSALFRSEWGRSTVGESDFLTLTLRQLTFDDYFHEAGWTQGNSLAAARMVSSYVNVLYQGEPTEAKTQMLERITALSTEGMLTEYRAMMAGELVGNAARMVMSSPNRMVFQQLNSLPAYSRTGNRVELGQVNSSSRMRLWLNPYAQSEEGDADGITSDGYSLARIGFMLGGDFNLTSHTTIGLVFNYGNPHIENDLGEVSANDYMVGVYAKMPLFWRMNLNAMIGYGMQQYTYEGVGGSADFDGDTIFGSLEAVRPFPMMTILKLTPVVGLDFQSLGMDDLSVTLPTLGRMPITPDGMDSVSVRIGLRGECMRLRTRVQYIRQLTGDDFMTSSMSLNPANSASARSVQWGKDWVNIGLGGELIQTRQFRLFADYDLDISKNTTSHLGSLSAVLMW